MAAIITIDEYKTYAGISSPNYDDQLSQLITPASELIQRYLGFEFTDDSTLFSNPQKVAKFLIQPYQQEYLLDETDTYVTFVQWHPAGPYATNSSIRTELSGSTELQDDEWFVDTALGKITFFRTITRQQIAEIEYKTSKTPTEDIKLATMMLVYYWNDKKAYNQSVVNQGQSMTKVSLKNLPAHIEAILYPYRKV